MSSEVFNKLLGSDGHQLDLKPSLFAEEDNTQTSNNTNDDDPTDDDPVPPTPPPPTPDDSGQGADKNKENKAHIYIYMASVTLILGLLYLCMFCCVRRKNMKGKKKPSKDELVEQKNQTPTARQQLKEEPREMNLEMAEMP